MLNFKLHHLVKKEHGDIRKRGLCQEVNKGFPKGKMVCTEAHGREAVIGSLSQ